MQDVLVIILGGGRGERLFPLTKHRSEPAVPIAGKYRLIDIPISNCINSQMGRIYVLTQYMSVSLHRHIANTYKFTPFSHGFVEVLAAQQTNERADWFRGTADAIRQNIRYVEVDSSEDVLILYGDQLYRKDFRPLLQEHRSSGADVTMAALPVTREQAGQYGIVCVDDGGRITRLVEKPTTQEQLSALRTPARRLEQAGLAAPRGEYLANMGIYFFKRQKLLQLLAMHPDANDVVTEVLAGSLDSHKVRAALHDGYWEDVGSIKAYYHANLALTSENPPFDFHVPEGVIYTRMRNLPASRVRRARVRSTLLSDGCVVEPGADLERCVLGVRCHISADVRMRDVVAMGANYFDNEAYDQRPATAARPRLGVGAGSVIERAIIDKNARIGKNVRITNKGGKQHFDGDNYFIREGIVIVPNSGVIADNTEI